jgi:hypothetical protein
MRRHQSSEHYDQEASDYEKAYENRRRVVEQVEQVEQIEQLERETEAQAKISPKTQGSVGREKHKGQATKSRPMRYSESNSSGKSNLWQELISDNPMLQKETLSSRRALELQTPIKRFFKHLWPLLFLGSIYLCVYVFTVSIYNNSLQDFLHRFDPNGYYERIGNRPNKQGVTDDWLLRSYLSPENYAIAISQNLSMTTYSLLLILQGLVVAIGIPLTAVTKITGERERMNWDSLLLSRMTPLQILVGKLVPVLQAFTRTSLALLPAIAIAGYMGRQQDLIPYTSDGLSLRGVVLAQICIVMTGLMNIAIAMYYSLTEKQGAKAALKTGQWFAIPTLGTAAFTGVLSTIIYLIQTMTGAKYPQMPVGVSPFVWFVNLINPIFVVGETFYLGSNFLSGVPIDLSEQKGGYFAWWCAYLTWLLLPFLYPIGCALVIRNLAKKMMRKFQDAPKDASG